MKTFRETIQLNEALITFGGKAYPNLDRLLFLQVALVPARGLPWKNC